MWSQALRNINALPFPSSLVQCVREVLERPPAVKSSGEMEGTPYSEQRFIKGPGLLQSLTLIQPWPNPLQRRCLLDSTSISLTKEDGPLPWRWQTKTRSSSVSQQASDSGADCISKDPWKMPVWEHLGNRQLLEDIRRTSFHVDFPTSFPEERAQWRHKTRKGSSRPRLHRCPLGRTLCLRLCKDCM